MVFFSKWFTLLIAPLPNLRFIGAFGAVMREAG